MSGANTGPAHAGTERVRSAHHAWWLVVAIGALGLGAAVGRWTVPPPQSAITHGTKANASAVLHAEGHGYAVWVDMIEAVTSSAGLSGPWGADWWAESEQVAPTVRMVSSLRIRRGATVVRVPRSAFADLAEVGHVSIGPAPGGCVVNLSGGDAATSWDATIVIRGDLVTEREVHLGEFPEDVFERTQYTYHPPDT